MFIVPFANKRETTMEPINNSVITTISDEYGDTLVFRQQVGNTSIFFNVEYVPEVDREWFCKVVGDYFVKVDTNARKETTEELQKSFRELLGIKDKTPVNRF